MKGKFEEYFNRNHAREEWRGIQHITNSTRYIKIEVNASISLAKELNILTRFEIILP